jgi:hypothetical protein
VSHSLCATHGFSCELPSKEKSRLVIWYRIGARVGQAHSHEAVVVTLKRCLADFYHYYFENENSTDSLFIRQFKLTFQLLLDSWFNSVVHFREEYPYFLESKWSSVENSKELLSSSDKVSTELDFFYQRISILPSNIAFILIKIWARILHFDLALKTKLRLFVLESWIGVEKKGGWGAMKKWRTDVQFVQLKLKEGIGR